MPNIKKGMMGAAGAAGDGGQGSLFGWGQETIGQAAGVKTSSPVRVGSKTNWVKVVGGEHNGAAIDAGGKMYIWGDGTNGVLGDGTTVTKSTPVQIGSDKTWAEIALSKSSGVAITTGGDMWAWGLATSGQLGDGSTTTKSSMVQVGAATDWVFIEGNGHSFVALNTSNKAYGWGVAGREIGQNVNGFGASVSTPIQIGSDTDWSKISLGGLSVGLKTTGKLYVFGNGYFGDGIGGTDWNMDAPEQIGTATNWVDCHSGPNGRAPIAVNSAGKAYTWGYNNNGQCGTGNTTNTSTPIQIGSLTDWAGTEIRTGASRLGDSSNATNFKIKYADNTAWAWGDAVNGFLGQGNSTDTSSPVQIGTEEDWIRIACSQGGTAWGIRA